MLVCSITISLLEKFISRRKANEKISSLKFWKVYCGLQNTNRYVISLMEVKEGERRMEDV
jgi:hypothetical protein